LTKLKANPFEERRRRALNYLFFHPEGVNPSRLWREAFVYQSQLTVFNILRELVVLGLVDEHKTEDDKRTKIYQISYNGQKFFRYMREANKYVDWGEEDGFVGSNESDDRTTEEPDK